MAPAWLDSLSEDWVSQPSSDSSVAQLPPLKDSPDVKSHQHEPPSRIPRRPQSTKLGQSDLIDSAAIPLSERSANDINISRQRTLSRRSHELKQSRSASDATTTSIIHNTVQYQSSPLKEDGETPEWKRRLVYGDVQYGEQRDLFCSAAAGLQGMFKPPAPGVELQDSDGPQHETTLPSSPPVHPLQMTSPLSENFDLSEEEGSLHPADITPSPSPRRPNREIQYKLNDESLMLNEVSSPGVPLHETPVPTGRQASQSFQDHSGLSVPSDNEANTRKASGQSVIRNEDFSPILIGKHSDEQGKVDFAPIELPAHQLKQKLERLRAHQLYLESQPASPNGLGAAAEERSPDIETTEDYAKNGGFINTHRGGRSAEGSFRFRGLSPGFGVDTSEMLPEESLQASTPKQFPSIRTEGTNRLHSEFALPSPSLPRAPFPSPEKRQISSAKSSGSPLKLFGPYDTFTNQTLLRRISQFEEGMSEDTPSKSSPFVIRDEEAEADALSEAGANSMGRFGTGHLENFRFNGDISRVSGDDSGLQTDKENISPVGLPLPKAPFFELQPRDSSPEPDADSDLLIPRRRSKSSMLSSIRHARTTSASSQFEQTPSPERPPPDLSLTPKRDCGSEGKRGRTSPSKDPTPKRRRTLHKSDIVFDRDDQYAGTDAAHKHMQNAMSKKRKDARPGDFQLADPEVLALRKMIRPRTPTPTRVFSQLRERHLFSDDNSHGDFGSPGDGPATPAHSSKRSPLRPISQHDLDASVATDRKPSIRTQDFVDQAAQIMAMIRSQVRPQGLTSVEESEAEYALQSPDGFDDSCQDTESTKEPLSRPPSREGRPVSRPPQRQEDPELLDRLKQYQEFSDLGDLISSSMRSVGLAKDAIRVAHEVERRIQDNHRARSDVPLHVSGATISDLPNVRITSNPIPVNASGSPGRDFPSNASSRSYPTASSRNSEFRRTIMPESISHLIPEKVGSMFLDKQNNIWIKRKESYSRDLSVLPSEDSEEDPFASIPDLSVDLTKELIGLRISASQRPEDGAGAGPLADHAEPAVSSPPSQPSRGYVTLSPNVRLSPDLAELTREEFDKLDALASDDNQDESMPELPPSAEKTQNPSQATRRRNLTISFSSPIASIIHDVAPEDLDLLDDDDDVSDGNLSALRSTEDGSSKLRGLARTPSQRLSNRGPAFIPRPVSRIDEQDEDSTVELPMDENRQLSILGETSITSHKTPNTRRTSLSFLVNHTPGHRVMPVPADDSLMIGQNVGKLSLSPLSEFTLNNSDQSFGLEVSYVMGYRHMATGERSQKVMSMTIRELVDKLSEVEPCEPYWEDLSELDLHGKRLSSLHMLDEFCGKVVTLDVSQNTLGHLEGVPSSVRQLKVSHNMLTELTSWDHLMNLQYVDISNNEVRSLSALKNLVHLRSLRADNNQLTTLDGLDVHDGLLSLRARNNLIEEVDFGSVRLERLVELDLEGNLISSVQNMELAPALATLRLPKNKLQRLDMTYASKSLRHVDVSDNELKTLDLSSMHNLHSLHADRNYMMTLVGCQRARRLDSLSLREQQGEEGLDLGFLSAACEVRKLFLSGNYLRTFEPQADFLNLQLLELANCGLQMLPANMGQLMPNLRNLNLNFNAIANLSPLQYIPRLKKLLVAGNRLTDSTAMMELLTGFPHLAQLDLRDNPVTLGFYAPFRALVVNEGARVTDPFALPDADVEKDSMYAKRLDETTVLRRRLHQIVFVASCKRLRRLDGLPVKRLDVLAKDGLYQILVADGLLAELEDALVQAGCSPMRDGVAAEATAETVAETTVEAPEQNDESLRSSRWNAEDSFA
jgi:hypothetical protein